MDSLLFKAKLAEKADNYDAMVKLMREAVASLDSSGQLSEEERNLLAVAYKNTMSKKRSSWRVINQIVKLEEKRGRKEAARCAQEYRQHIEQEILALCDEADRLAARFATEGSGVASRAFFLKFRADCQRYIAELPTDRKQAAVVEATSLYDEASRLGLPADHHISLGITLNKAILHYEILDDRDGAIAMIEHSLRGTAPENKRLRPLIINLLDDNLKLWQAAN